MTIQILADSACDLTKAYYKKFSIEMVPLTVHLNNQEYEDGIEISPKKVYDAMREGAKTQTSQVSPQVFKSLFTSYAKENKPLVYLAFSRSEERRVGKESRYRSGRHDYTKERRDGMERRETREQ